MDIDEQTGALCDDLNKVLVRYSKECDLNSATVVGVLAFMAGEIIMDTIEQERSKEE